jgi:hypothetical protein
MKKILIMLLLVFLLSSCQKKSNSLNNLEECITNLCDDDDIGDLLGLYISEYIDNEFENDPFIDSEQNAIFYGYTEYSLIGVRYVNTTGNYSEIMMKLNPLYKVYETVSDVDVSTTNIVNPYVTYTVREDDNRFIMIYNYEPAEDYDVLRLTYDFKDEYNLETVETVISFIEELETHFVDFGEVHLEIRTIDEEITITYMSETQEVSIELEDVTDTMNSDTRLGELEVIIESLLTGEYSINSAFIS